jgi:E3 ubiquitin-protein ligase NRDP1
VNRHAFLSEDTYLFRTALGNKAFYEGTHYWEIVADAKTENELKIGVVSNRDIDL